MNDKAVHNAATLALCYGLLIIYASLFPFSGWHVTANPFAWLSGPLPRSISRKDALVNLLAYIPFGFLVGNRGAMAGIGVSIGIAMAYWGLDRLSEQVGNVGQLDPAVATWAPDALFALAGIYFMLRMRS